MDELWVRVGGGLIQVPGGQRYGPAREDSPPPGGPWKPLLIEMQLVGWGAPGVGAAAANRAREEARRLIQERRALLLARLGHKLRSSVLALQEWARQAAFGRHDLLEQLHDQAREVGRRASALEAVALEPVDPPRAVVLGAVLNLAAPHAVRELPADALVQGSEPALLEALSRAYDWMGGEGTGIKARRVGGWWELAFQAADGWDPLSVTELGEPLVGFLIDARLDGWLETGCDGQMTIYLPALGSSP
jgi:hypothetical protein